VPKSKKPSKPGEEKQAWRKPVKLPANASVEPMKSLYAQDSGGAAQSAPRVEEDVAELEHPAIANDGGAQEAKQFQESLAKTFESQASSVEKRQPPTASPKRNVYAKEPSPLGKLAEGDKTYAKLSETDFLKLLRTEKMDFYSLAEVLRGSSMALYCVLYSESLAKGENRCQMRQTELMMRAGINNPATLYKQERWLTALRLINKTVRLGNHSGASYEVRPLETLPLPRHILNQFSGYLSEIIG